MPAISAAVVEAGDGGNLPESGYGTAFSELDDDPAVAVAVGDGPVLRDLGDGVALPDPVGAAAEPDREEYLSSP